MPQCLPEKLDFGDIVVGNSVKKVIHLQNESDCGLNFNLKVDEKSPGMLENEENVDFVHRGWFYISCKRVLLVGSL